MSVITGKALLCFLEDGSHFQGMLITKGHQQYALSGKPTSPPEGSYHQCCFDDVPMFFNIKIIRHSTNEDITIKHVMKIGCDNCSLENKQFEFHTDELLVGAKAETAISQFFDSTFLGRNCYICVGKLSLKLESKKLLVGYVLDNDGF